MRRRALSVSSKSSATDSSLIDQELDSLYDYLAKIILLGCSGTGKSCVLHRFVAGDWQVMMSQTIGVEFSSKIIKVGNGPTKRNIKLQLWDTAGQERFRSLTRGYYRGSAGVLLVYDITTRDTFEQLGDFMADIRALTSPTVSIVVLANKTDLKPDVDPSQLVSNAEIVEFCIRNGDIPLMYTSAKTGYNVQEAFERLASIILTKIELGVIDPEDVDSGVQYGEVPRWDSTLPRNSRILGLIGGGGRGGGAVGSFGGGSCC